MFDDRNGQIATAPGVGAADVDRHALPFTFDLHVNRASLPGNSPRMQRWTGLKYGRAIVLALGPVAIAVHASRADGYKALADHGRKLRDQLGDWL
jgi:hypothetical protein